MAVESPAPVLELRGLRRSFGPVEVLRGVDLTLRPGRVHALIGENGAGKSTTMKIMAGHLPPSAGRLRLDGREIAFRSPAEAEARGVVMIHQEFNLAEHLTVEQNLFLGRELKRGFLLDKPAMRRRARELLGRLDREIDPDAPVSSLSNSDKQMLEIAKALAREARLLIMDEPTAVLTRAETQILLEQIRALKAAGTAVLFTSHKLEEVKAVADDLSILRDGALVYGGPAAALSPAQMAEAMVGREMSGLFPPKPRLDPAAPLALSVRGLEVPGFASGLSFDLRQGEILGVAGLIGAGRTEAFEGLCGLRPARGEVEIFGEPVEIRAPWEALALGMAYLTEDRKTRGLLLDKIMRENLTLQALARFSRGLVDQRAEERALDRAVREFDIRTGSRRMLARHLSGGNQQKLLLAKTLLSEPRILIVDEPTRGVDTGAKRQIYAFIRDLAAKGRAIVVISSEMQELIGLSDRLLVLRQGRILGELEGEDMTEEAVVRYAMGVAEGTRGRSPDRDKESA